jgi:hypothetical protein
MEDLSKTPTTLSLQEWKKAAEQLYAGNYPGVDKKVKFGEAKQYLGIPNFDGDLRTPTNAGQGKVNLKKATTRAAAKTRQAKKRSFFDQTSTEEAVIESKRLADEVARINKEAEMFGFEPFQIEHLADQRDIEGFSGAGGDPSNKLIVSQPVAFAKNRIKEILKDEYAVTINAATDSIRAIPKKFFDPNADPATLPGIDFDIDKVDEQLEAIISKRPNNPLSKLVKVNGSIRFQAGSTLPLLGLAATTLSAGQAFAAGDVREGTARTLEGVAGEIPIVGDIIQPETVAGGTFEDVERRTAEGIRAKELQQRAAEARQRGGKLSFGSGPARFTLPEFGLSELMGIN